MSKGLFFHENFFIDLKKNLNPEIRIYDNPQTLTFESAIKTNLKQDLYLTMSNIDGSDLKQVTNLGNANWSPFFHPSNEKIIFCSNAFLSSMGVKKKFNFKKCNFRFNSTRVI